MMKKLSFEEKQNITGGVDLTLMIIGGVVYIIGELIMSRNN